MLCVQEVLSQLSRDRYTLKELQEKPYPPGVDPLRLESYLTDEEFQVLFLNSLINSMALAYSKFHCLFWRVPEK